MSITYVVLGSGPLLEVPVGAGLVPRVGDHVKTSAPAHYVVEGVEWHLTDEEVTVYLTVFVP